jgi:ABC-type oligopeptide transport system substrate-binding subunit
MRRRTLPLVVALAVSALTLVACTSPSAAGAGRSDARILQGSPATLDPAATGDAGSAAVIAQLFETLTVYDEAGELRPALAASWTVDPDGRRMTFTLRPDLAFSDGTPLRPSDVVRSWMRLLDPAGPSPLVTLMDDVVGARAYTRGEGSADAVGLHADDDAGTLTIDFARPAAADFVSIVASPTFAVVPPGADRDPNAFVPGEDFVASGGYRVTDVGADGMTLEANDHYWAGRPALTTITLVDDLGGQSPVEAFEDGEIDYAPISSFDASWIAYDQALGPRLREVPSLSTNYYGFDTTRPPFDDVRVRQAVAAAVDWRRIAMLADGEAAVATSMVPPGIPDRSAADWVPVHDPERARALLAEAGYPGGQGFPTVTIQSGGSPYDDAVVFELERELGIDVSSETMDFDDYVGRLDTDAPAMWFLSWVADYPGRNDFLGILLGSDAVNNYGRWASDEFDAAIADAGSAADPAAAATAYDRAESIVQRDAPVIPVSYGTGWALARDGLLGAGQNGLGNLRLAGMAWAD